MESVSRKKQTTLLLSVVLPVCNEQECVRDVIEELLAALASIPGGAAAAEVIAVDDASGDATPGILRALAAENPGGAASARVRVFTLPRNMGQSAALGRGIRAAAGEFVCTMDADGQNDPRDIARCLAAIAENGADACFGWREKRRDSFSKRAASRAANFVRRAALGDNARDTGCSMRVIRAELLRDLQVWNGMHRFFPALVAMLGAKSVQIPVNHRARAGGRSHYSNLRRLATTMRDLAGVRWLASRAIPSPGTALALEEVKEEDGDDE